ncbi:fibronectin type III domain-containing protein [Sulfurimonas sp. MAG313]|nr:fibronectin type III domain-containing protein [Sulfurimonas sp. MAG313]MDF1880442.1 fibronectin type III domain-containing protein [Sulfurimonas sp. MAG313]
MNIFNKTVCLAVLPFVFLSCGSSSEEETSVPVKVGSLRLSWSAPVQNTDNSTLDNLAGYKIYYGENENNLSESIDVTTASLESYVINNLKANTKYYFSVTAINTNKIESSYSNIVSKVVE